MRNWIQRLARLLRHRWAEGRMQSALPDELLERLGRRVAASEQRHSGEIRICVEAGLPLSYVWRDASPRERAVALFGKLRVWDTEYNNGVLIYLLLADHAIEIIADRGLTRVIPADTWEKLVQEMGTAFHDGHYEDGMTQALGYVTALLHAHFAVDAGAAADNGDELPDAPVRLRAGHGFKP
jgi:uncharacterized membrane protein